jgi:hypothetical protein
MHVRGIAGQQDPSFAVGCGLAGHVGEPRYPGRTVDPVIGPIGGDEGVAEVAQGRLGGGSRLLLGDHDPHRPSFLQPDGPVRHLGHLDLGDEPARRRIQAGEADAGCLADETLSAIAPDEIIRPQSAPVRQLDGNAAVVLHETGYFASAMDGNAELGDPAGQDALDVVLKQRESVIVAGGKVADVQGDHVEAHDLSRPPLGEEAIGDPALIQDLEGARMQTASARADEVLAGAPLDNGNIDPRQGELAGQHQPCRTCSGNHHRASGHRRPTGGNGARAKVLWFMPFFLTHADERCDNPEPREQLSR